MTHIPGKFVWFELVTRDAKRAQAFYGEVFGWKVDPMPMGPGSNYDMVKSGEHTIGGYAAPEGAQKSHWISYASVVDIDASVKAAVAAGGRVVAPAIDVPTVGRMQRIADPLGAELNLFSSLQGDSEAAEGKPGTFCWNELHTSDPARAVAFYQKVLGYSVRVMGNDAMGPYNVIESQGKGRGGIMKAPMEGPSHWLPYVHVASCDQTLARAVKQGGTQIVPGTDIPDIGRFAVFADPVGATIAILQPKMP